VFGKILLGVWVVYFVFMAFFMAFPFAVARFLRHVEPLGHVIYWLPFVLMPITPVYIVLWIYRESKRSRPRPDGTERK